MAEQSEIEILMTRIDQSIRDKTIDKDYSSLLEIARNSGLSCYSLNVMIDCAITSYKYDNPLKSVNQAEAFGWKDKEEVLPLIDDIAKDKQIIIDLKETISQLRNDLNERNEEITKLNNNYKETHKIKRRRWPYWILTISLIFSVGILLYLIMKNPQTRHDLYVLFPFN